MLPVRSTHPLFLSSIRLRGADRPAVLVLASSQASPILNANGVPVDTVFPD
jgi:hypothetical protein